MTCKDCVHHNICIWENELEEESNAHCTSYKNKADFVEVVRCKDCIFYEPHGNGKVGICRHLKLKRYLKHNIDFCSYGERRDTE